MSRHTENKEEILKVHNRIDLIDQKLDTLENNHLAHMQKDIDRIIYIYIIYEIILAFFWFTQFNFFDFLVIRLLNI